MALATLVEAFGVKDITPVRIRVYEKALSKVPVGLLRPMVERAVETRRAKCKDWLPDVADLLADAEACRLAIIASHPYESCCECEDSPGWREFKDKDGILRLQRCPCWHRYRERIAQLGVGGGPLALPAATTREWVQAGEVE